MATIREIADAAGVSVNAVSRILNGRNKENRPTAVAKANKVRRIARELGYRPNAAAQAMKEGRFKSILLLKSTHSYRSHLPSPTIEAIQTELARRDHRLLLATIPDDRDAAEQELHRLLRERFVDGILVAISHAFPEWLRDTLDRIETPKVWIGSRHHADCVYARDRKAARDATERLIARGHRDILYLDYANPLSGKAQWHFSCRERELGYRSAMKKHRFSARVLRPGRPLDRRTLVDFTVKEVLASPPSAIIAYGMWLTGRAVLYALARRGLTVPDDLSFLTFASEWIIENDVLVSCYGPSLKQVGETAARMVLERVETGVEAPPAILPFEYIDGDSISDVREK